MKNVWKMNNRVCRGAAYRWSRWDRTEL